VHIFWRLADCFFPIPGMTSPQRIRDAALRVSPPGYGGRIFTGTPSAICSTPRFRFSYRLRASDDVRALLVVHAAHGGRHLFSPPTPVVDGGWQKQFLLREWWWR
jgi:hypothetical protein